MGIFDFLNFGKNREEETEVEKELKELNKGSQRQSSENVDIEQYTQNENADDVETSELDSEEVDSETSTLGGKVQSTTTAKRVITAGIIGSLVVIGGTIFLIKGGGGKSERPVNDDIISANELAGNEVSIGDVNDYTQQLVNEQPETSDINVITGAGEEVPQEDTGISEEEFRQSLAQSDSENNVGSEWDNIDESPVVVNTPTRQPSTQETQNEVARNTTNDDFFDEPTTNSTNKDDSVNREELEKQRLEEAKRLAEEQKKQEKAQKLKSARTSGMSFGKSDPNPQKQEEQPQDPQANAGEIITNVGDSVPSGTYEVDSSGNVRQVPSSANTTTANAGGNSATTQPQPQAQPRPTLVSQNQGQPQIQNQQNNNYNPFTQTDPNITGRGRAGYGSISKNNSSVDKQNNSEYTIMAGSIIPTVLLSGIKTVTSDMAIAVVSQNVYNTRNGKHLLIPKGSRLIGEYSPYVDGGNYRVITIWNRLIFPNGDSINLTQFKGVDMQGYGGMKAQVNTHFWKKLGNVVMSTLTSVGYNFADRLTIENGKVKLTKYNSQSSTGSSGSSDNPTTLGEVISAIQQEASGKNSAIQTVLTIKQGTKFNVRVNTDLVFDSAYKF